MCLLYCKLTLCPEPVTRRGHLYYTFCGAAKPSTSCSWRRAGESCGKMSTVVRPNYGSKGTDNITDLAELEGLLSPFQVEKLTYFFNQFFDFNMDGKIDVSSPLPIPKLSRSFPGSRL